MHPRPLLDYDIDLLDPCNIRSLRRANCWFDHAFVHTNTRLGIKPTDRNQTVKLLKRSDDAKPMAKILNKLWGHIPTKETYINT